MPKYSFSGGAIIPQEQPQQIGNNQGSYTPLPQVPQSLSSNDLNATTAPLQLPPAPQEPDYLSPLQSIPSIDNYLAQYAAPSPLQGTQNDLQKRILDITARLGGKPQAQAQAEQTAGLPEFNKQLTDVNNQIQALQKEAYAIPLQVQNEQVGLGATRAASSLEQNIRLRENAIKALGLSSIAQTLQGNISLAQQQADRAVAAEFDPLQAKLDYFTKALEFNRDNMNAEEKKRATIVQAQLEERQRLLDQQRSAREAAYGLANTAIANFPNDPNVQYAAQQALKVNPNDPDYYAKVLNLIGKYQQDPMAVEQAATQLSILKEQLKKLRLDNSGGGGIGGNQLYNGLSSATATAVRSKVAKFSSEPIIQNFATIQDGYNFASNISNTTTNPADDQALIYSLAKALDPGSVVREGEYATAQKYAQSWVKAYGTGVSQAILGTGFLSQEARRNIKATIQQKYSASKRSYDNLYDSYVSNINSLTARDDGASFLQDYVTEETDFSSDVIDVVDPQGQPGSIPKNQLLDALKQGFRRPTAEMNTL